MKENKENKGQGQAPAAPDSSLQQDNSRKKSGGKFSFRQLFMSKRMRYGSYSLIITAIVVVVAVLVNVLALTLESSLGLRVDLTANKLFSLQNETIEYLDRLGVDSTDEYVIHVYGLYQSGAEEPMIQEVLGQYVTRNKKIRVEYFDPVTNPTKANQFLKTQNDTLERGSVIVSSADGKKFKIMTYDDLFPRDYEQTLGREFFSLRAEQQITSAMMYVTQEETPVVYFLQSHQEVSSTKASAFSARLRSENYEVEDINLTATPDLLTTKDTLIIASPKKDVTDAEREVIKKFLQSGGRAMFFLDVMDQDMPNLASILQLYDVGFGNHIVVETETSNYYQRPTWLVPQMGVSVIMDTFRNSQAYMFVPDSGYITMPEMKKTTIEVISLLSTTAKAFAKEKIDAESLERESGDIPGPFNVGVSVFHDNYQEGIQTRFVVFGTSALLDESLAEVCWNFDVLMKCVSWMDPAKESTNIRMRSLQVQQLNITSQAQLDTLRVIVLGLLPVLAFVGALVIYLKRRHL